MLRWSGVHYDDVGLHTATLWPAGMCAGCVHQIGSFAVRVSPRAHVSYRVLAHTCSCVQARAILFASRYTSDRFLPLSEVMAKLAAQAHGKEGWGWSVRS